MGGLTSPLPKTLSCSTIKDVYSRSGHMAAWPAFTGHLRMIHEWRLFLLITDGQKFGGKNRSAYFLLPGIRELNPYMMQIMLVIGSPPDIRQVSSTGSPHSGVKHAGFRIQIPR